MSGTNADSAPVGRLADFPLAERQRIEADKRHELQEGMDRRHLQNAQQRDLLVAANFARIVELFGNKG